MIVRILEAATDRWAETATVDVEFHAPDDGVFAHRSVANIELLDGESVWTRRGDARVFAWHRGDANVPATLASALMALEKWLYDEHDADRDISAICDQLLHVQLLCRHGRPARLGRSPPPGPAAGPLLPLLSSAEVLLWDQGQKLVPYSDLLLGLLPEPALLQEMIRDWNSLEHRRVKLGEERSVSWSTETRHPSRRSALAG